MRTLVLNKSNVVNDNRNSRFKYNFITPIKFVEGDQIALSNAQIPYSNFNIMSQYNNNKFSYSGNTLSLYDVVFPDGFYTVDDMNYYLQQKMIENNHYLVNANGENVYYIKISTNQNRYRIQIDFFVVPTTLPLSWSNPGFDLASVGGRTLALFFDGSSSFNNLLGFNIGTYGNQLVNTSYLGDNVPSPALVNSYLVTVPTIVSQSSISLNSSSAVYAKTPDVDFGNNIIIEPNNFIWIDVNTGNYPFIEVILCSGDDGSQLTLQDPNSLIMLVIKSKDE